MHFFEQIWLNPHFKTQKRNKNGLACGFNRNFWKNVVLKPHAKFFDPLSTRYNGLFSKIKTTHTTPPGPPYNISGRNGVFEKVAQEYSENRFGVGGASENFLQKIQLFFSKKVVKN